MTRQQSKRKQRPVVFFFNKTTTPAFYALSLHDALPIFPSTALPCCSARRPGSAPGRTPATDRKSTRLNSSHANISYAVFCLKKKNIGKVDKKCPQADALPLSSSHGQGDLLAYQHLETYR